MQNKMHLPAFVAKRRLLTVLPILVFPFLTVIYWAVGVRIVFKNQPDHKPTQGLNTNLPGPKPKAQSQFGKLSFYQQAQRDSAKRNELIKKDPYRVSELTAQKHESGSTLASLAAPDTDSSSQMPVSYQGKTYTEKTHLQMARKLKSLDSLLSASPQANIKAVEPAAAQAHIADKQLEKLQQMITDAQPDTYSQDQEIAQLNELLEKVIDIQHPERMAQKVQAQSSLQDQPAQRVSTKSSNEEISLLSALAEDSLKTEYEDTRSSSNGFFSIDDDLTAADDNALQAVIDQDQTVLPGSTVKIRLTTDAYISGKLIAKNSFVYGTASLSQERLLISVKTLRIQSSIFQVSLSAYDLDGNEGIYVPGAIEREVTKQSTAQQIQSLSVTGLDPSLGAQAASAGIQAAKTLFSRKARLQQVHLKAGYQILLKSGRP
ncbi:conjugative transposon protein TraM [Dyadobacter luteus]|uniref:Conjugative transposon protein TraM n=1 Tax=Dyadobacter luteus TaxID=2259619 RepID=A0A3D8Y261_9BACT|nr:conjugative transposon protein TraM [Dyadobacter luteus]REA55059.1 conjugative transposon protein TraM [Dyadobacter luteus]